MLVKNWIVEPFVVQVLLGYGADPRIYADDGQSPEHVSEKFPPILFSCA